MSSRRSRTLSAAAALFTAFALGVPAAVQAAATGATGAPAASTALTVTPQSAPLTDVVLPTGDRITVGTGVNGQLSVDKQPGGSGAFASLTVGRDRYVIPSEAAPYAGRSLDLSLFDVTKPAAAAAGPSAHIPVQLSFAAGVTPTAPAGVTFTSVSGRSATGYLTPESGKAFAQALRDSIKADLAAGKAAGTGPLFGGVTSIAALGAAPPVQPFYPLHVLQLNTLDGTGAPSNAFVLLINTDSYHTFNAVVSSYQGVGKVAVPAGNYAAISVGFVSDPQGNNVRMDLFTRDGITVPAAGTVPPVTVDERTATSQVTFTTQKPATAAGGFVELARMDASGDGSGAELLNPDGSGATYVSPDAKPAVGSLNYAVYWVGQSPATAASAYQYDFGMTADHIDANQSYAPADSSLATLRHTFNLDPAYGTNAPSIGSGFFAPFGVTVVSTPATGRSATEYVTGGLRWLSKLTLPSVAGTSDQGPPAPIAYLQDDGAVYNAGQTATRTWAYAPEAPSFGQHPAQTRNRYTCQACVGAGNMVVTLGMLGDTHPDTTGVDNGASGTAQLYLNGQLVSSDTDRFGYLLQHIPAGPVTVREVFDYDRSATGVTQSTKIHTDVTVPYSGQNDPSMTLPPGTDCLPAEYANSPNAPCQVLPALTLNYQLNALSNTNTSHSPIQNLVLHVGHVSYGGVGSQAPIESAQVSVSFDNGTTWQDVPTHGADGTYTAHWANPAAGSPVELRVTATDCLGGSITQSVTNPYTVG